MPAVGQRARWWAFGALAIAVLTVGLDNTILSVAAPTLATSLNASTADLQWFTTAYMLVMAAFIVPAGGLGDRFGRRRLLLAALFLFGASSAACAFAGSAGTLIGARVVLGLAAAFSLPLSLSIIPVLFSDREERFRVMAMWVALGTVGAALGPVVGGALLAHFWWGSVFLINVPFVAIGMVGVALLVPESRSSQAGPVDIPGVLLSAAGLVGVTYGFISSGQRGWSDAWTWLPILLGAALLVLFAWWEVRVAFPLIDLGLFRNRSFCAGTVTATLYNFAVFGLLFAVPQFLQAVGGYDPLGTGLRLLPMILGTTIGTRFVTTSARRIGTRGTIALGFAISTAGLALGVATQPGTGYLVIATWMTMVATGVGLGLPGSLNAAMSALSTERSGAGSGLVQSLRQVGAAVGVAVLGAVLSSGYRGGVDLAGLPQPARESTLDSVGSGVQVAHRLGDDHLLHSVRSAFTHGMDTMLLVCAILTCAGAVVAMFMVPRRTSRALPQSVLENRASVDNVDAALDVEVR